MSTAKLCFELRTIRLSMDSIVPIRQLKNPKTSIVRYGAILASIREVGVIEPLMIHPQKGEPGKYLLVDGHLRYEALKELGKTSVDCIIAKDDEGFTYNARISRLAPVQEHKMIMKAIQSGVSPEKIASALNITVQKLRASMNLLDGIHEEAIDLLKDKVISPSTIRLLRKVAPLRQIEIAEMMINANDFTIPFAEALILGTARELLVKPKTTKKKEGLSPEAIAKMEEEMEAIERDFRAIDESYGENMLNLTLARTYIKKLLDNAKVVRFLNANHAEILSEFECIVAAESM